MTTPPAPGPDVVRAIVAEAQAPRPRTRPRASDGSRYTPAPRPAEKRCRRCGALKPRSDYWNNVDRADGLQDWCKPCKRRGPRGGVSPAKLAARRALEPTTILHGPEGG